VNLAGADVKMKFLNMNMVRNSHHTTLAAGHILFYFIFAVETKQKLLPKEQAQQDYYLCIKPKPVGVPKGQGMAQPQIRIVLSIVNQLRIFQDRRVAKDCLKNNFLAI